MTLFLGQVNKCWTFCFLTPIDFKAFPPFVLTENKPYANHIDKADTGHMSWDPVPGYSSNDPCNSIFSTTQNYKWHKNYQISIFLLTSGDVSSTDADPHF